MSSETWEGTFARWCKVCGHKAEDHHGLWRCDIIEDLGVCDCSEFIPLRLSEIDGLVESSGDA